MKTRWVFSISAAVMLVIGSYVSSQKEIPTPLAQDAIKSQSITQNTSQITSQISKETTSIVDGYTDKVSYFPDETQSVYINAKAVSEGDVLLYDILGNVIYKTRMNLQPQTPSNAEPYSQGYGYKISATFHLPSDMRSGVYFWEKKIPFLVKSKAEKPIVVLMDSNTSAAYNCAGEGGLYGAGEKGCKNRPTQVSFQRPMYYPENSSLSRAFIKWISAQPNQNNMKFISDIDMDDYSSIEGSKLIVISGHSEYWTRLARENFDKFINRGGNAAIFSGNTMWWQVKYSPDKTKLICYKTLPDPEPNPLLKTTLWSSPLLKYPTAQSIGASFEHGGWNRIPTPLWARSNPILEPPEETFNQPALNGWNGLKIIDANSPVFAGLNLNRGDIVHFPAALQDKIEYDGNPITGYNELNEPIIDQQKLGFYKIHLLAFDRAFITYSTAQTAVVFQKTASSGIIVNMANIGWSWSMADAHKSNPDQELFKRISSNVLNELIRDDASFRLLPIDVAY
jgi:hypothetical protein